MLVQSSEVIDPSPWIRVARILAKDSRLTLKFDKASTKDPQPRIDLQGKVIYVPTPSAYWSKQEMLVWLGMLAHEIGHDSPSCRDSLDIILSKNLDMRSPLGQMFNLIDDYRNEKTGYGHFAGRDQALSAVQGWASDLSSADKQQTASTMDELIFSVFTWYYLMRAQWQPDVAANAEDWVSLLSSTHSNAKSVLSDLIDNYALRLDALPGSPAIDAYNLALDIMASNNQEKSKEEIEQESQSGEYEQDESSKAAGELVPHEHESADELGGNTEEGEPSPTDDGEKNKYNVDLKLSDETPYTYRNNFNVVSGGVLDASGEMQRSSYDDITARIPQKLTGVVRRLLQVRTQTEYEGGYKRGRLNSKALFKYKHTDKIFKRMSDSIDLDVVVQVVIDCSGSMAGSRFDTACGAAIGLVDALQSNGIGTEVLGFTDSTWGEKNPFCYIYEFKRFNENISTDKLVRRFGCSQVGFNSNPDGEALLHAFTRIAYRSEKRKIMLVLSDGQPTSQYGGHERRFLRDTVQMIQKHIEIYAFGIESRAVEDFYPEYSVIYDKEELKAALLSTIKSKIIG
jgi:hypothetical protein